MRWNDSTSVETATLARQAMAIEFETKVVFAKTGSIDSVGDAIRVREERFPPTAVLHPTVAIFDLGGLQLTPSALKELVLPLLQRVQRGQYGPLRIVVAAEDPGVRDTIEWMANYHNLAVFIASSPESLMDAKPAGPITPAEAETLEVLALMGGKATASSVAQRAGIEPSAANNRLVNLLRRGFLYRVARSRSEGDMFFDPRAPSPEMVVDAMLEGSARVLPPGELERTRRLLQQTLEATPTEGNIQVY